MIDIERLLPCPFCGGENVRLLRFDGNKEYVVEDTDELSKKEFYPYIHCYGCEIDFCPDSTATPQDVIQAWNKRVYPEQPKVSEWIPCNEKLPETGKKVLVCCGILGERDIAIAQMYEHKNKKYWNIKSVVHAWQQLPEPYKEGEKN